MSNGIWRKISIQVLTSLDYTHRNEKKKLSRNKRFGKGHKDKGYTKGKN